MQIPSKQLYICHHGPVNRPRKRASRRKMRDWSLLHRFPIPGTTTRPRKMIPPRIGVLLNLPKHSVKGAGRCTLSADGLGRRPLVSLARKRLARSLNRNLATLLGLSDPSDGRPNDDGFHLSLTGQQLVWFPNRHPAFPLGLPTPPHTQVFPGRQQLVLSLTRHPTILLGSSQRSDPRHFQVDSGSPRKRGGGMV